MINKNEVTTNKIQKRGQVTYLKVSIRFSVLTKHVLPVKRMLKILLKSRRVVNLNDSNFRVGLLYLGVLQAI